MDIIFPDECARLNALPLARLQRTLKRSTKDASRCCFARCSTPHALDNAYSFKEDFKSELQEFRKLYDRAKASRDRDNAISNLEAKLARLMCEEHRAAIEPLFKCYVRVDTAERHEKVAGFTRKGKAHAEDEDQKYNNISPECGQQNSSEVKLEKMASVSLGTIPLKTATPSKSRQGSFSRSSGEDRVLRIQLDGNGDQTPSSPSPPSPGSDGSSPDDVFDKSSPVTVYGTPGTEVDEEEHYPIADQDKQGKYVSPRKTLFDSTAVLSSNKAAERSRFPSRYALKEQIITTYNNERHPRAAKTRLSYLRILKASFGKKALQAGTVYIAKDVEDKKLADCHKIGVTKNTVELRYSSGCDRRHNMKFIRLEDNEVPYVGAQRVEQLLQLDFYLERLEINNCAYCEPGRHVEWFRVGEGEVVDRLRLWKAFITAPGLYDSQGNLTTNGSDAIDRILNPGFLITNFLSTWKVDPGITSLIPPLSTPKEIRELWAKAFYATNPKTGSSSTKGSKQRRATFKQSPNPSSPTAAIQANKPRSKDYLPVPHDHTTSSSGMRSSDVGNTEDDGEVLHRDDTARLLLSTFKENNQRARSARLQE